MRGISQINSPVFLFLFISLQGQFPPPLAQSLTPSVNESEAGKSANSSGSLSSSPSFLQGLRHPKS